MRGLINALLGHSIAITVAIVGLIIVTTAAGPLLAHFTVPNQEFSSSTAPPTPDYSLTANWAALPDPGNDDAKVDLFYLYPTSYLLGRGWNADTDNFLANLITDHGVLAQQANTFADNARIYVPRYRQVSQGGQMQSDKPQQKTQALALAYSDLQRALDYYLQHHNRGRPFFIASHSQGTTHGVPLLQYLFANYPEAASRLIAAYLVGNTVSAERLSHLLPVCTSAAQTGCYLSWNSMLEGGDASHWLAKGAAVCVNPLSWRQDELAVAAQYNLGAIKLTAGLLPMAPQAGVTGARCKNGMLWITPPTRDGYDLAVFPGGSYHAYDYNLFYSNIKANVNQRTRAFLGRE